MENGFPRGFVNHSFYSVLPTQSAWAANAVVFFLVLAFLLFTEKLLQGEVTTGNTSSCTA